MNEEMSKMLQGFNLDGLVDKMGALQNQHVTIGGLTFDKTTLDFAEEITKDDIKQTQLDFKSGKTRFIKVSKHQFDKEFNK